MSNDRDRVFLQHIDQAAPKILRITLGLAFETFGEHDFIPDIVIRQLEIIGKASIRVSEHFKTRHPDWPWREMKTIRNFLIHGYHQGELAIVWDTAQRSIPELNRLLAAEFGETSSD